MDVVFLHGPPAAGKLTTARAQERVVGFPVFHDHLVVDLLTGFFPFGTDAFVRLRERFWLDVPTEAAALGRSVSFTYAPDTTVPPGFPARVVEAVGAYGGRVRFVRLTVSPPEQERRVELPDRREFQARRRRLAAALAQRPPARAAPGRAGNRHRRLGPGSLGSADRRALLPAGAGAAVAALPLHRSRVRTATPSRGMATRSSLLT